MRSYLAALVFFGATAAAAKPGVFLNGVNIDGVTNQTFANCTVTIDAQGNVFIAARGYAVAGPNGQPVAQAPAPGAQVASATLPVAPAPAALAQHYWLVTEKAAPGMSQYDLDLYVNSKFVRRFVDDEEHVVLELTKYLSPGENKLTIIARKNLASGRRSSSPQHYFRLVIGEGDASGRNVMISRKLVDYRRTALETKDFSDEFFVTAN